ncbi:class II fructose-bisphosphate aldolase [Alicyclobacillus curvatus]|nr:class II fructose-bisphosphate aldolase [Alicyclobacillus curvatus]
MIGDIKQLLSQARSQISAVPAFNVDSVDMALAVIEAAEQSDTGIIIQVTADTLNIWGWQFLSRTLLSLAQDATIPVALMLDHAKRFEDIQRAIDLGFRAVMFDGSALPLSENIEATRSVVAYAYPLECFVEGEVGHVARAGEPPEWEHLTTVDEASEYVEATKVGALAVAVGSKHGEYRNPEDIKVERVHEIYAALRLPLVLHGGSGMPPQLLAPVIRGGITKINVGTELRHTWWDGIDQSHHAKPREALLTARFKVQKRALELIEQFKPRFGEEQ